MFAEILSSVRWNQLGVTAAFMVIVLLVHFVFMRPAQQKALAKAKKLRIDMEATQLQFSIQSVTGKLFLHVAVPVDSARLPAEVAKLQAAMNQIAGPPALLEAMQNLIDATTKLAASNTGEKAKLESGALQLANACLAVEQRLPALVPASTVVG
ncbi:hypothetical protein [Roseateles sp. BYS96W]|uniref:Uncharacterized protein n=1 Tax=Pelomonas nitida TaxID=3299027 RepID=A0ABW7G1P2_9BURK